MVRMFLSGVGECGVLVGRDIVTVGWHGIGIFFLHILNRFGTESVTDFWMIWIFGVCCSLCMMLLGWAGWVEQYLNAQCFFFLLDSMLRLAGRDCILVEFGYRSLPSRPYKL